MRRRRSPWFFPISYPPSLVKTAKERAVRRALNRRFASFFGANSNNLINRDDKNLSVAYLFGTSRSDDSF
jgi:hypothetical protein